MALYANQETVRIDKPKKTLFCVYGKEEMAEACKVLNGSAFKVWCYLLSNNDGVFWDISPAAAENSWGIKQQTFRDAIKELKEKGFIKDDVIHQTSTLPVEQIVKPKRKTSSTEFRGSNPTNFVESHEKHHSNNKYMKSTSVNNGSSIASSDRAPNPIEEEFYF